MQKLSIVVILLLASWSARAASVAILSVDGGFPVVSTGDQLYGWFFTANQGINVTQLGVFDSENDGLDVAHEVGIYRVSDQALLGSAIVPSGTAGSLLNGFRYTGIAPIALLSGDYAIVMTMPDSTLDGQNIGSNGLTTAAEITWTGSAFAGGSALIYPSSEPVFDVGMFGPNFQFSDSAADAPEPGPAFLLVSGGIALGLLRRRTLRR